MRTGGLCRTADREISRFPRKERLHMPGSLTTPSRPDARDGAPGRVAFLPISAAEHEARRRRNLLRYRTPTGTERDCVSENLDQHSLGCHDAMQPHAQDVVSASHAKNDVHDALHFIEPLRIQVVRHLDVFMVRPGDLEREARGSELD